MSEETQVMYHLPQTYLQVTGTKTTWIDLKTGEQKEASTAEIELGIEADPNDYFMLDLSGSALSDQDFSIGLTDDQRLTSASGTSTGRSGAVLKGVASIAGTFVGALMPTGMPANLPAILMGGAPLPEDLLDLAPTVPDQPVPPSYAADHPDMADRLEKSLTAATKLTDHMSTLAEQLAGGSDVGEKIKDTTAALESLRKEIAILERHRAAWREKTRASTTEHFSFRIPINQVPSLDHINENPADGGLTGKAAQEPGRYAGSADMLEKLHMVVAHQTPPPEPISRGNAKKGETLSSVISRIPHYTELVLLKHDGSSFTEVSRTTELVMSETSLRSEFFFDKAWWGKKSIGLTFSDLGAVTGITAGETSGLAGAATALSELPASVAAGMTSIGSLSDAAATARSRQITQSLARIELEKKALLAQVVDEGNPANEAMAAEIAKLELQKKRLTLLKEVGALEGV